jgi:hypothetical protein
MKTQRKTAIDANKVSCETTAIKIESQNNSSSFTHFIKHPTDVFVEPRESAIQTRKPRGFDPVAQEHDRLQPTSIFTKLGCINSSESITGRRKYGAENLTARIAKSNVTPLQSTLATQNLTGALRLADPGDDQDPRNQISS